MHLHNIDAEEMLVGSILADGTGAAYADVVKNGGCAEMLWHPHARAIYEATGEILARGDTLSHHAVTMRLAEKGDKRVPDGILDRLAADYETTAQVKAGFRTVFHLYRQRTLYEAFQRGMAGLSVPIEHGSIEATIAPILDAIGDVTAKRKDTVTVGEVIVKLRDVLNREITALPGELDKEGLSLGLPEMDRYFGRVKNIELVVIGAAPSTGKSSIMRQMVMANLHEGKKGIVFSLEVGTDSLLSDMAAEVSQVSRRTLRDALREKQEAFMAALDAVEKLCATNLLVYDSIYSAHTMEATIRTGIAGGFRPDFIAVDYLQIMEIASKKGSNKASDIGDVTRRLKLWTKMFRCPVILLSQLSREGTKGERAPRKTDLRDSGSIEADADRILLLFRPEKDRDGNKQENTFSSQRTTFHQEIIQDKYRDGIVGSMSVDFHGPTKTFKAVK